MYIELIEQDGESGMDIVRVDFSDGCRATFSVRLLRVLADFAGKDAIVVARSEKESGRAIYSTDVHLERDGWITFPTIRARPG